MQNAKGETMASFLSSDELFEERPIGGRAYDERFVDGLGEFVYLARIEHDGAIGGEDRLKAGVSALYGPNSTGRDAETWIAGVDIASRHDLRSDEHMSELQSLMRIS